MLRKFQIFLVIFSIIALLYCIFSTPDLWENLKDLFSADSVWLWGPWAVALIDGFVLGVLYQQNQSEKENRERDKKERLLQLERDLWKARCCGK